MSITMASDVILDERPSSSDSSEFSEFQHQFQQQHQQHHPPRSTVGLVLTSNFVEKVVEGGPADRSGRIHPGDEILAVDGISVSALGGSLASRLRGDVGSSLSLRVRKWGSGRLESVQLVRQALTTTSSCDVAGANNNNNGNNNNNNDNNHNHKNSKNMANVVLSPSTTSNVNFFLAEGEAVIENENLSTSARKENLPQYTSNVVVASSSSTSLGGGGFSPSSSSASSLLSPRKAMTAVNSGVSSSSSSSLPISTKPPLQPVQPEAPSTLGGGGGGGGGATTTALKTAFVENNETQIKPTTTTTTTTKPPLPPPPSSSNNNNSNNNNNNSPPSLLSALTSSDTPLSDIFGGMFTSSTEKQLESAQKKIAQMELEMKTLKGERDALMMDLKSAQSQVESERDSVEKLVERIAKVERETQEEIESKQREILMLKGEREDFIANFTLQRHRLEEEKNNLAEQIERLSNEVGESKLREESLMGDNDVLIQQLQTTESNLVKYKGEAENSRKAIEEMQQKMADFEAKMESEKKEMSEKHRQSLMEVEESRRETELLFSQSQNRISELEIALSTAQTEQEKESQLVTSLSSQVALLASQLSKAQQEYAALANETSNQSGAFSPEMMLVVDRIYERCSKLMGVDVAAVAVANAQQQQQQQQQQSFSQHQQQHQQQQQMMAC